jgi:hypothetical protein
MKLYSCYYIKDDYGDSVYFREDESDKNWKYLKELRKIKLEKINN